MDLPEDGPHLKAGGLVRGDTVRVEPEDEVVGVTVKKSPGEKQVLVSCAILDVAENPFCFGTGGAVRQPLDKLGI